MNYGCLFVSKIYVTDTQITGRATAYAENKIILDSSLVIMCLLATISREMCVCVCVCVHLSLSSNHSLIRSGLYRNLLKYPRFDVLRLQMQIL